MKNRRIIFLALIIIILSFLSFLFFLMNIENKTLLTSKKKSENVKKDTVLNHIVITKKSKKTLEVIFPKKSYLPTKKNSPKKEKKQIKELDSNIKILQIKQDKKDSIEVLDTVSLNPKREIKYIDLSKIKRDYINKLINYINEKKQYPKISKRLKQEGIVFVKFTIEKTGQLTNILITKKSNFKLLDKQAYETINQIKELKKIPIELNLDSINIEVPIEFKISK